MATGIIVGGTIGEAIGLMQVTTTATCGTIPGTIPISMDLIPVGITAIIPVGIMDFIQAINLVPDGVV